MAGFLLIKFDYIYNCDKVDKVDIDKFNLIYMLKKILGVAASLVICGSAGLVGSLFTTHNIPIWYDVVTKVVYKPALTPPSWVFGPVWTILYILMAVSLYIIWRKNHQSKTAKIALIIFGFQLVLNALWSYLFFELRNTTAAFIDIMAMWLAILACIILFSKISKGAAWLLVPYILWVTFAGYLNYSFASANIPTGSFQTDSMNSSVQTIK